MQKQAKSNRAHCLRGARTECVLLQAGLDELALKAADREHAELPRSWMASRVRCARARRLAC
jgi:hypothetical protein